VTLELPSQSLRPVGGEPEQPCCEGEGDSERPPEPTTCALVQASTLDGLRDEARGLLARLEAGERGLLRAGGAGSLRAAFAGDELGRLEALAHGAARSPRPRTQPAPLAFLFPGQGAQRPAAAAWWSERPAFAEALAECAAVLDPHLPRPLRALLVDPDPGVDLGQTALTQPLLVAFGVALAAQWRAWGVAPTWVTGHSLGELCAAWAASCCTTRELLELSLERGRAMQALPAGAMAVVFAEPARVEGLLADLGGEAWVAARNGAADAVIAGPSAAVERARRLATLEGLEVRPLEVSFAAHGPAVEPALPGLEAAARRVSWSPPRVGWVSTATAGAMLAPPDALHWRNQTRRPVRFADSLATLRKKGVEVFLELGPGASLTRLAAGQVGGATCLASAAGEAEPAAHVAAVAARLWERGIAVDWERVSEDLGLPR